MIKSIQRRLNLIYGLLIFISFVFLGAVLLISLESYLLNQAKENLAREARMASWMVEPYLKTKDYAGLRELLAKAGEDNEVRITIIAANGNVIADSQYDYKKMDNHLDRPEIQESITLGLGFSIRKSDTAGNTMLYCAYPIRQLDATQFLRVAISISSLYEMYNLIRNTLLSVIAVIGIIALYIGFRTARSITTPIAHLKYVAEEIEKGNFQARASVNTEDELHSLGIALNKMADKLDLYVARIQSEKIQLETIFEHLSAGVIVMREDGCIILINSATELMFHVSRQTLQGRNLQKLVRDEGFEKVFYKAVQRNQALDYEFGHLDNFLRVHFVPLKTTTGDKKVVALIYDITTVKQWQQMRSDFVANASHELRTPLTAIRGYTETLLDGALDDKQSARTFLQIIERESERLTRIVEDLLDLSRLERKASINREVFELRPLVENVVTKFAAYTKDKEIIVENKVSHDVKLYADYDWLEQVFVNLIDNAVKYSKQNGRLIIEITDRPHEFQVSISDTGIGIPYQDLPRIFERFYRVDKSRSRSLGGTGLGLAIVKHIIESHGGSVSAASALGEGTTISFTLPKPT